MFRMKGRRSLISIIVAALALVNAGTYVSARSLEDTVKLAVIKKMASPNPSQDQDAGKQISATWDYLTGHGYVFGNFRLMSLTSDEVCGSIKRPNGATIDFLYVNGGVFLDATHREMVGSSCHQPHKTSLAGKVWALSCFDPSQDERMRHCRLATPLAAEGEEATLSMLIIKGDRSHAFADLVLSADVIRGRRVAITISGATTDCALAPVLGQEDVFWPCDETTSQGLSNKFVDSKAMTVKFGDRASEFTADEPRRLLDEAERYFLTFPGGEIVKPQ